MEALSVKAGILVSLFGFLGIIGLVALAASVIWLVIRVSDLDSVIPSLVCVVVSLGLIAGGLFLSPTPDYQPEPPRAPWEAVLDWAADRLSGFLDRRSGDGTSPSSEEPDAADAGDSGAPDTGDNAAADGKAENPQAG